MSGTPGSSPKVINPAKSPPLFVPIGMILAGLASLLILQPLLIGKAPLIFGEFRFNPATLAAVHLFTLGFATAVMAGAFYQITPVMMLGKPVNGRLALAQGLAHLSGTAILVTGFYYYAGSWMTLGGTIVVLSLLLFMLLVGLSMRSATQWTISGSFMLAGLSFLAGTILWGLTLAFNLRYNFLGNTLSNAPLGAHVVLGLGGWFMLTIFGVTYQLIPMFALSQRKGDRPARTALALLTIGLWAAFLALTLHGPALITAAGLALATAGAAVYAVDMSGILRQRRRPELDLGMRYAVTSFGFLALALPLLAVGAFRHEFGVSAVWLFLPGFVGCMILGMLYKIVPFLFWHYLLKTRREKTQKLPNLTDMYSGKLAEAGYWCWAGGVLLTGLLLAAGAMGLSDARYLVRLTLSLNLIGSLLFTWTILQVLRAKPLT